MSDAVIPDRRLPAPLLTTKLFIPTLSPDYVARQRLHVLLHTQRHRRLTMLSAPAGFGKSSLLAAWIAEARTHRMTPAWVALDSGDSDPVRFWTYLAAAIHQATGNGATALAALQSPHPPPIEPLLVELINELAAQSEPLLLVLDDLHTVEAPEIYRALGFLIDHLPPQVHLVLAGRADPPLPLARWRARGVMHEVRAADLRFTQQEATELLTDTLGLPLSKADIQRLEQRTEGWATGLQLAALALRDRPDPAAFIDAFTGSHRYVLAYLVDDVLAQQPEAIQAFLLRTAVLERMCADLCAALLADAEAAPAAAAQEVLEDLERANLFLTPLDATHTWYRYHHLFAEVLRHRLQRLHPDLPVQLHRRASAWYEQAGLLPDAVQHALSAGDPALAARLLDADVERMLDRGELATLLRLAEALGDAAIGAHLRLGVYHAYTLVRVGQYRTAERQLDVIAQALDASGELPDAERRRYAGVIATIRAALASIYGNTAEAEALASSARALLTDDQVMWRGVAEAQLGGLYGLDGRLDPAEAALATAAQLSARAGDTYYQLIIAWRQGRLLATRGHLHAAAAAFQTVQRIAEERGVRHLPAPAYAMLSLADILREWDELDTAEEAVTAGIAQLHRAGSATILLDGLLCRARIRLARADLAGARQSLDDAETLVREQALPQRFRSRLAAAAVRVALAAADLPAAARWAAQWELELDDAIGDDGMSAQLAAVRLLLAQGQSAPALERLSFLQQVAETAGWGWRQMELGVLTALAHLRTGAVGTARRLVRELRRAAEPEGYTRIFCDEGPDLLALLDSDAAPAPPPDVPPTTPQAINAALAEPLSERELEVLTLVAAGLSNQAIADRLIVSIGTVKKHIEHIHGKLGVRSRTAAVAYARSIGLIA